MKNEISSLLRTDFLSFARKAIRRLEGTTLSRDRYLELLASVLSAFADATTKQQLLVNLPPRHLKTLLGSVCLSAWILGRNPNTKIMLLACSEKLAEKISGQIHSIRGRFTLLCQHSGIRRSSRHGLRKAVPK
jgi:hypothetical protein